MFSFTLDQFKKAFPKCKSPADWHTAIFSVLPTVGITTKAQVLCFLAQTGHESGQFNTLRENFNYSADGLLKIFPKYFKTVDLANQYARQPEKIANLVYANRMGNGAEASGDGYKYRGVGLIQVTGKDNITRCSKSIFGNDSAVTDPSILATPTNAVKSAAWFWNTNNLNKLADAGDMVGMTKKINGGTIGLNERVSLYETLIAIAG